jgi:hypothetical protein
VRHAGQTEVGDFAADVELDDLAVAVIGRRVVRVNPCLLCMFPLLEKSWTVLRTASGFCRHRGSMQRFAALHP